MDQLLPGIVGGVVGAAASGSVTFVLTRFTIQKNLEVKYDVDLRRLRLESYAELWSRLLPLALFARDGYPTRELLEKLTHSLTHWYFGKGGLYLSEHTRDAYLSLATSTA